MEHKISIKYEGTIALITFFTAAFLELILTFTNNGSLMLFMEGDHKPGSEAVLAITLIITGSAITSLSVYTILKGRVKAIGHFIKPAMAGVLAYICLIIFYYLYQVTPNIPASQHAQSIMGNFLLALSAPVIALLGSLVLKHNVDKT